MWQGILRIPSLSAYAFCQLYVTKSSDFRKDTILSFFKYRNEVISPTLLIWRLNASYTEAFATGLYIPVTLEGPL